MKKRKGFTLIEILIVVIILAVLASMVLPRFLGQTENAYIAEAQQQLGVLRRASANAVDLTGAATAALTAAQITAGVPALGLGGVAGTNFTYTCTAFTAPTPAAPQGTGSCTAIRTGTPANTITLSAAGFFTCEGAYQQVVAGAANARGCRT